MGENLKQKAINNLFYNFLTNVTGKLFGIIFMILLARILLPELFGLYNLVFTILALAIFFTDIGISETTVKYVSENLREEGDEIKARSYFRYLLKTKVILTLSISLILILSAKLIANSIFNKPIIFFPLIFGSLYVFAISLSNFFRLIFLCTNNLSKSFLVGTIYEPLKIIVVIIILYLLPKDIILSSLFIGLTFLGFILIPLIITFAGKDRKLIFGKRIPIERRKLFNYLEYMSLAGISIIIFGYVDTLMLGRFVEPAYLAFYRVGFGLVAAIASFFTFSSILLPIFSRATDNTLGSGLEKIFRYLAIIIIPSFFGAVILGRYFILTLYGNEYLNALWPFYVFSLFILILPLESIYLPILQLKEKTKILFKINFASLILNIILNYVLIKSLLNINQIYAITGAGIATVISRLVLNISLILYSKRLVKIRVNLFFIIKPVLASLIMAAFLIIYNSKVDINILTGLIEIFLGALIYFIVMFLIKGVGKEDIKLIKSIGRNK
ncbi:oligosaccharide flippase family protein [Candidatus Pacearchaeota archaeon]|nr:oligosaccharide flippase family protein [Candidatus Pacearchaeota archaeon]